MTSHSCHRSQSSVLGWDYKWKCLIDSVQKSQNDSTAFQYFIPNKNVMKHHNKNVHPQWTAHHNKNVMKQSWVSLGAWGWKRHQLTDKIETKMAADLMHGTSYIVYIYMIYVYLYEWIYKKNMKYHNIIIIISLNLHISCRTAELFTPIKVTVLWTVLWTVLSKLFSMTLGCLLRG